MIVIKKDGTEQQYDFQKIINAVTKSADRVMVKFLNEDYTKICSLVEDKLNELGEEKVDVPTMHHAVEYALSIVNEDVAKSYKEFRNYKNEYGTMLDDIFKKAQNIMYRGDKSNANTDSALVATKRSLIYNELNKELYQKFFMTKAELQACRDGYIYVHDMSARRDTMNCCLFDLKTVMSGGFEMGNQWYNEPKSLDTFFDVMGDVILATASQQYGGFTIPEVDKIASKYAEKSYNKYYQEYIDIISRKGSCDISDDDIQDATDFAYDKTYYDALQGWQGIEYKLNTVGSSRGDYPFITVTLGLATDIFGKLITKACLVNHRNGQGKPGFKIPTLFPKIVFLYTEDLHSEGKINEDLFEEAILTSSKTMYPDYLSLDGDTNVAEAYHKWGVVISPMGCRAFLSPWFERGGMEPSDDSDKYITVGRFNIGAVSLHLSMILAKSRKESKDFYEVLDYYLEMIRNIHRKTYEYLGNMKASINPVAFCEGGFYGGHLQPSDKIKPILKPMTASFGITGLNELQRLYNGKSIKEDGEFALEVMKYIDKKINEFKKSDGYLYAIYGTPAESLCFSGNTLVQTSLGNKQIKDIKVGDLVYSFNEEEHKIELKEVINSCKTKTNAKVVKVTFDNGQEVICTPNHKFAVIKIKIGREHIVYIEAKDLKKNDRIKSHYINNNKTEKNHKVLSVEYLDELIDVYDITVNDNHNFFVGGDNGILVHNCGLQVQQFRKIYGIIENVSDRDYISNSFHCHVTEEIQPTEKQDLEGRFWDYFKGGRIQYVRYTNDYNLNSMKTLVRRAMKKGFYEGLNMSLAYCNDCGCQKIDSDVCPKCGSSNLTKIDRMNGYLAFSRVKGDTRLNSAKMAEIKDRISM